MQKTDYNYARFKTDYYDFEEFNGPDTGKDFPDFLVTDLNGKQISLSDFYQDKWMVFQTGSITCPVYLKSVKKMNKLQNDFPETNFLTLYVREAHPGKRTAQASTMEEKIERAKKLKDEDGVKGIIVLDDLEGTVHRQTGSFPNLVYVIAPGGKVIFRSNWNNPDKIRKILKKKDSSVFYPRENYGPVKPDFLTAYKALSRGGNEAFIDLFKNLPKLIEKYQGGKTARSGKTILSLIAILGLAGLSFFIYRKK